MDWQLKYKKYRPRCSGKKDALLDSSIKSSYLESIIELIIEREETFEYNSHVGPIG